MRYGLCGGTFDPFHNGHLALIEAALATGKIDRMIVMPAGVPPHKRGDVVSFARYRLEIAAAGCAGDPRVEISDLEILRPGPSYTLDTARQISDGLGPDDTLHLVYGSDVLADIPRWHQPARLLAQWPLLLADRGGVAGLESRRLAESLRRDYQVDLTFFDAPSVDLSSTRVRDRLHAGSSIEGLVPDAVLHLIEKHGIYRYRDDLAALDDDQRYLLAERERQIWPLLTSKRHLHTLNVVQLAVHIARRHDLPLYDVAQAAMLHDVAKCLPAAQQQQLAERAGDPRMMLRPLIHGPAGAVLAAEKLAVEDAQILDTIHYHPTGRAGMSWPECAVFIADKCEWSRPYPRLAEIRRLAEDDLMAALRLTLSEIRLYLGRQGKPEHPYARAAAEWVAGRTAEPEENNRDD